MGRPIREPRAVFLTGAGLSADSGIRTYRGEGGYYQGIRAEQVMSDRTMRDRPEVIHRFCDDRRVDMRDKLPNSAHRMIAELQTEFGDRVVHLTQNIDILADVLDNAKVIHLHGVLTRMRSIGNSHVTEDIGFTRYWDGDADAAAPRGFKFRCPKTNSLYRPDVVLFGEMAPEYRKLWKAMRELGPEDVLVVIGTQGSVLPVNSFADNARSFKILNNLHPSDDIDPSLFDRVLMARASEVAEEVGALVRSKLSAN